MILNVYGEVNYRNYNNERSKKKILIAFLITHTMTAIVTTIIKQTNN